MHIQGQNRKCRNKKEITFEKKYFLNSYVKKNSVKSFFTNVKHFRPIKADPGSNIPCMTLKICKNVVCVYANNV